MDGKIKLAIVDDDAADCALTEKLAKDYFLNRKIEAEVTCFFQGSVFLECMEKGTVYDIAILDVDLPGQNGLEIAGKIKKYTMETIIVFLTDYVEYAPAAFEVNAFRYIVKKNLECDFTRAMDALMCRLEDRDRRFYIFESGAEGTGKLYYNDIYYIRSEGKYIHIVHRDGTVRERKALKNIYEKLDPDMFLYVDKSYIANILHITSWVSGELTLRGNIRIPISRPRYKEVTKKILNYWRNDKSCISC